MKETKIHYVIRKNNGDRYICNQAVDISIMKSTREPEEITCENCWRAYEDMIKGKEQEE